MLACITHSSHPASPPLFLPPLQSHRHYRSRDKPTSVLPRFPNLQEVKDKSNHDLSTEKVSTSQLTTSQHTTSQHLTAHHLTAHHLTTHHLTTPHSTAHYTAHHLTTPNNTPPHGTSHHLTSQHTTSQHNHRPASPLPPVTRTSTGAWDTSVKPFVAECTSCHHLTTTGSRYLGYRQMV